MMNEEEILYETGDYYVALCPRRIAYEVIKNGPTHATVVATIGLSLGLARAKTEADKRALRKPEHL